MMIMIQELPPELQQLITTQELAAGQILFQQGDPAESIFWVELGHLKLVSFADEQMITHYTVGAGESFAETALNIDIYSCTAIADQFSRVLAIPKRDFLEALQRSPHLCARYVRHLTQRFESVKQLLELRSIRSARERVLHYLRQQCQPGEFTVPLSSSLKGLAADLGLSPESLSRTFSRLETEQVLSRKKGSITLLSN
ncbi:MAG: Crp/Fnr family transcriptional regulator [Cyanobacteria bacterium P01_G01_bin.38]